jgi:hypothetical protein
MIRIGIAVTLLFVLMSSSPISGGDEKGECICPNYSSDWTILSDTSTSIPDFFFQPYIAVKRMLVCDHGIYFFFSTKEKGRHQHTCLAYPKPTEELYFKYFEKDSLKEESAGGGLHAGPQKFLNDYELFKARLQRILGGQYEELRLVYFDRHYIHKPTLSFSNPLAFTWKHRRAEFQGLLDVYYK